MLKKTKEWGDEFCIGCEKKAEAKHKSLLRQLDNYATTRTEEEERKLYLRPDTRKHVRDFDPNLTSILQIDSTNKKEIIEVLKKVEIKLTHKTLNNLLDFLVTKSKIISRANAKA
jgi:hypothetical protein